MGPESKILVVLAEGVKRLPASWRKGAGARRFSVVRSGALQGKAPGGDRIDAVLFQVDESGRAPAPLKDLKRISRGAPLLPFRLERHAAGPRRRKGAPSPRDADPCVLPIAPTLDARFL